MSKRKLDDAQTPQLAREESTTTAEDSDTSKTLKIAEHPFQVRVQHLDAAKGHRKLGTWSSLLNQNPVTSGGLRCGYRVSPAQQWNDLTKYNKFVVSGKSFVVGDYVYIFHGNEYPETSAPLNATNWVAQVLEIRASDAAHVYLRVFWMYWPDELPGGRKPYHGAYEVVRSNHMEIMDAMTVTDGADVRHLDENGRMPTKDLYWRQTYDAITGRLSKLRRDCYCNEYHNPEQLFIQCPHCDEYLHETCLLRDACFRAWLQEQEWNPATNPGAQLPNGTSTPSQSQRVIPDSQRSNGTSSTSSQTHLPPPPSPRKPIIRAKGKKRRLQHVSDLDPWEDLMKGHLGMKVVDGEETSEATGMAAVDYDPIDQPPQSIEIGLRCLLPKCGKWLYDEPPSQQEVKQEAIKPKWMRQYQATVETDEDSDAPILRKHIKAESDVGSLPTSPEQKTPSSLRTNGV